VLVRPRDREGILDNNLEVTNEHMHTWKCCERWRLVARRCLRARRRKLRRGGSTGAEKVDKTLDALVSNVPSLFLADPTSSHCEHEGFGVADENSVGPWTASRVLVSDVLFQMA
jgi:hypothetical protein